MDYYSLLLLSDSRLKLIGPDIQFLIQRDNLQYNLEVRAEPGAMLADLERIGLDLGETSKFKGWQLQDFANFCKPWQQKAYQACLRLATLSQQGQEEPFFQTLL